MTFKQCAEEFIRAQQSCLKCHQLATPDIKEGDLIAMVRISVPTDTIRNGVLTQMRQGRR